MSEPNSTSSLLGNVLRSTVQTLAQLVSESTPLTTEVGEVENLTLSGSSLASSLFPGSQVTPTQSSLANSTGAGDRLVLVGALRRIKTFLRGLFSVQSSTLYNSGGVTTTESTVISSTATDGLVQHAVSTISDMLKGSNESSYSNLLSGNSTLVSSNVTNSTCGSLEGNVPRFETVLGVFIIMFCILGFIWSMEREHFKELFCGEDKTKEPRAMLLDSLNKIEESIYENPDEDDKQNKEEKQEEDNSGSLYENLNMDEDSDYDNVNFGRRRRRYHDENGNEEENISFVRNKKNDNEDEEEVTYINE
ncbi:hypothetical protein PFFVO_05415 [Plasmodium falciparum Vietnam Oak-Knoll (FVO)]|uniref:Uncharacterized protein n=1 Tax=Plasmodium falciparum Vietnam Oak-Knoll (FVO) TaxID=1036723 RepID=A0A024V0A1_PLAFA|nr:hypothetical protein PFFVO_05415 [Plasmodium falciparum Vietnam Oak-Knoll (FVO)]